MITLGIIGVVAAMTMPVLIQKYTNHVVETRLKAFYSQINEAIRLAEAEYGDKKYWYEVNNEHTQEGCIARDEWFQKYIGKHMKIVKKEINSPYTNMGNLYYLANGSAFGMYQSNIRDWVFFPGNPEKCAKLAGSTNYLKLVNKCAFLFNYVPIAPQADWEHHINKGMEPWKYAWDGTEEALKNNCSSKGNGFYCTTLIQLNNWTIPKDYPYKVSY